MTARVSVRPGALAPLALAVLLLALLFFAPGLIAGADPYTVDVNVRFSPPSWSHPFGTDDAGRDIFARMVYGARISIGSSLLVVAIAAAFGTLFGAACGWFGGWVDRILSRATDVFLAFPYLVLAMAVAASIGRDMRSAIIALVIVWWPSYARMVRGQVLALRNQLHVRAARTLGASDWQLLRWHVIPHTLDQVLVRATLDVGYVLISLTGLSFLGLGAQNPSPEWGLMVASAKTYALNAWWYVVLPGAVIVLTVMAIIWLGERLSGRSR
jgi:peptide/nickel transport system permease protein